MRVKILIVDDHKVLCEGLRSLLEREPDFRVVGEAMDGVTAVEQARRLKPDVVIMDIGLPGLGGVEATRRIRESSPQARVVCLSMHTEDHHMKAMLGAGARGYVPKDCAGDELVRAVRAVVMGQVYLSPTIAGGVVEGWLAGVRQGASAMMASLTSREQEVLKLIAEGCTTRDTADRLHVSVKTVASHRKHIMEKLKTESIAGLTKVALREGLVAVDG
jgi:DNA-binding NarL/FixJ family response regulator